VVDGDHARTTLSVAGHGESPTVLKTLKPTVVKSNTPTLNRAIIFEKTN
jgi:hypothetical protein